MASIKARLARLEKKLHRPVVYPCVVVQAENESLEDAKMRALNGQTEPPNWCFVLVPETLSEEEWTARYSPY